MNTLRQTTLAAWLSGAIYLIAATISVVHAAEFGHDDHEHEGEACFIEHVMDNAKSALASAIVVDIVTAPAPETHVAASALVASDTSFTSYAPRAPPVIA